MIATFLLCAILSHLISDVGTNESPAKCGEETADTLGTRYNITDPDSEMFMEIDDHEISSNDISRIDKMWGVFRSRNRRVVYGNLAESTANFPWIADLAFKDPRKFGKNKIFDLHICGGAIINEYFVLTAAHCVQPYTGYKDWISNFRISVGEYEQRKNDPFEEHFDCDNITIIKDRNKDLAIIKIKPVNGRGFQFSKDVQPVCLPTSKTDIVNSTLAVVGGWGKTHTPTDILGAISTHLFLAELPLLLGKCQGGYICTLVEPAEGDSCQGDSGGPLVQNLNGRFILIGLVSSGPKDCRKANEPHQFVDVKYHIHWILEQMKDMA